ncbi:MAG: hypothetical protein WDN23_04320 [Edaphobacter sp.]
MTRSTTWSVAAIPTAKRLSFTWSPFTSGYFLRRQFIESVKRERGGVATSFLKKAMELKHLTALQCAEGRYIYHLHSKQMYRLAGREDSQSRRLKSTPEIRRRLVALDYVLRHLGQEKFIESDVAGQQLFTSLKVKPEALHRTADFLPSVPTSFLQSEDALTVRFAFVDEARSTSRFAHFLEAYGSIIRALERAVVAYVSTSPMNFTAAERLFERYMPIGQTATNGCPLGVEHLVRWLETRQRFHSGRGGDYAGRPPAFTSGGEYLSCARPPGTDCIMGNGAMDADKVRRLFHAETHRARFVAELIDADYPRFLNTGAGSSMGSLRGRVLVQKTLFDHNLAESEGGG